MEVEAWDMYLAIYHKQTVLHILHLLAHHTQGVDEGSGDNDSGAVLVIVEHRDVPVSYTHLDVYKRQIHHRT